MKHMYIKYIEKSVTTGLDFLKEATKQKHFEMLPCMDAFKNGLNIIHGMDNVHRKSDF